MEIDKDHVESTGNPDAVSEPESSLSQIPDPEKLEMRYNELNDRFLRLAADFDNFRKRTTREREMYTLSANEHFAVDILEIADNLERALKSDDDHIRQGVLQIRQLLTDVLARHGVTPIDALKKSFDPSEHEAIVHISSSEDAGTVIDEVSRGYRMHEKVIRYAKVAVSKGNKELKKEL